jgi:hypothetical protein
VSPVLVNPYRFPPPAPTTYSAAVLADSPLWYARLNDSGPLVTIATPSSSSNFSGEPPANAFDASASTFWDTNGTSSGWLQAQLSTAVALTTYKITRRDDIPNRNPKTWTFKGSNDGTTFTTLDTQTNITWPTTGETKTFTFTNTTAYLYYRLDVTANNGDTYLSVGILDIGQFSVMADSSGNGRNGTYGGSPTLGATGLVTGDTDKAVTFNGTSQQAQVPYGSWLNTSALTLEAIIKLTSVTGSYAILDRDGWNNPQTFSFQVVSGKLQLTFWLALGGPFTCTGTTSLTAGTKYHVAAKFDPAASLATVLLNGVPDGTYSTAGGSAMQTAATTPLTVAAAYEPSAGGGPYFSRFAGTMDEAAYYGTALSGTRIAAHAALI